MGLPDDVEPDPDEVGSRGELGVALTALRGRAGLSVRAAAAAAGMPEGTLAGWFAGNHVPTAASREGFARLLSACGVREPAAQGRWWRAVDRARRAGRRGADGSPYKGLAPYEADDAAVFRGRARLTATAAAAVAAAAADGSGVVAVVGPSGAGKSSLVRAGLVPALTRAGAPLSGRRVVVLTPARDSRGALEAALAADDEPVLLVVDQLEELFTRDGADPGALLAELGARPAGRTDRLVVVLVLRADFFARAAAEPALLPVLAHHQVVVGAMDSAELREAVVEPARRWGREVEPELVDALLADLGPARPGALPLLSHALRATWDTAGPRLTLADYRRTGSLAGAVAQTAERVHERLDAAERAAARRVFLRLVTVSGEVATRRTATPAELADADGAAQRVVGRFAAARLLTLGDDTVEVSHEALLAAWPRLRGWVAEYRDDANTHRRVADAAALWEAADRAPEYLLRGGRREAVAEWVQGPDRAALLNASERALLAASAHEHGTELAAGRRRSRRLVQLSSAAVAFGVLALVAAVVAGLAVGRADRQQADAVRSRDAAVAIQLAGESVALRDRDPSLAAQLALAAYRTDPSPTARSALLDTTAGITPTRATGAEGSMAAASTPDGDVLAVARADGSVELDRVASPGTRVTPVGRVDPGTGSPSLYAAAIDPTGTRLAVAGASGLVRVVDISDPAEPRVLGAGLSGATGTVRALQWSPRRGELVAASGDGQAHRWEVHADGTADVLAPVVETGALQTVAYSPDGRVLATGASDGTVKLWDVADPGVPPVPLAVVPTSSSANFVLALRFSPDGRTLAVGAKDKVVRLVDVSDPRAPVTAARTLEGLTSYVNGLDFSPDGAQLVAGGSDSRTLVWDLASGAVVATLGGPAVVTGSWFLPGARVVVTTSGDGTLRLWPLSQAPLAGAADTVFLTDVSADGRVLAVGPNGSDQRVLLWDLTAPGGPRRLGADLVPPAGQRLDSSPAVRGDGRLVASGTSSGAVVLWDTSDPARPAVLGPPLQTGLGLVQSTSISRDGRTLTAALDPGVVVLWDVSDPARPRERARLDVAQVVLQAVVSPDGRTLAAASGDDTVRLWDLTTTVPRPLPSLGGFGNTVASVSFSADSARLAAGSYDRTVGLWDVSDPAAAHEVGRARGPAGAVVATAFAPDGHGLAAASRDGSVWLWQVAAAGDPTVAATLSRTGGKPYSVLFDPVGDELLAFGGDDSRAGRVWTTDPGTAADRVCAQVGDTITAAEWATYAVGVPYAPPCG